MLTNIQLKIILKIFIFTFNKTKILFINQKFVLKNNINIKTLSVIKKLKIIYIKNFVVAILNIDNNVLIINILVLVKLISISICFPS